MRRLLSELEDKHWFPSVLRGFMTDYLQFLFSRFNLYSPVTEIIHDLIIQTRQRQIIDLCSGSGGPLFKIRKDYFRRYGSVPAIVLTDKFLHSGYINYLAPGVIYYPESVNAMDIPVDLTGIRTMFSSLHHFTGKELKVILSDAAEKKQPVAFFDSGDKHLFFMIAIIIFHPLLLLLYTPFIKPFNVRRLLFTYVVPLVVFGAVWDGLVSVIHLHSSDALKNIVKDISHDGYNLKVIQLKNNLGMKINSIIGTPVV